MRNLLHYIALDGVGGVEILFHELLKKFPLPDVKHSLALYTDGVHRFFKQAVTRDIDSVHSIKYFGSFKLPSRPYYFRRWNSSRILKSVNADVALFWNSINHDNYLTPGAYQRKLKIIFYDQGTSWYREKHYSESHEFLSNADLTLCCSYASKRVLELYHQHTGPMRVIHNPLRPSFFEAVPNAKTVPHDRPIRLGIAGRFVHIKGISLAIHSIAELKSRGIDVELWIAGTGKYGPAYQALAKRLGIEAQVFFGGLVEDMAGFFSDIDIFVCPSIREPFGIVAVEAMGKGCPLICARVDGLAEVVTDKKTGMSISPTMPLKGYEKLGGGLNGLPEFIYNTDRDALEAPKVVDPKDIADAVARMVADHDGFQAMSRNCIHDAARRFSFNGYLDQLVEALNTI